MMAEMGAKNAYIAPDDVTWDWIEQTLRRNRPDSWQERLAHFRARALYPDTDALYANRTRLI